MKEPRLDSWCGEDRIISHSQVERIQDAIRRESEGEFAPVSLPQSVPAQHYMTPQEFRGRLIEAKTKKDLIRLLRDVGSESGKFNNTSDEERRKLGAIGVWDS